MMMCVRVGVNRVVCINMNGEHSVTRSAARGGGLLVPRAQQCSSDCCSTSSHSVVDSLQTQQATAAERATP